MTSFPGGDFLRLRIVVVGAGIAGLTAAGHLARHGHDVVVFDKGRGPGGRSSSRSRGDFRFDHGAQYFTARDQGFREQVRDWQKAGVVDLWNPRLTVFEAEGMGPAPQARDRFVGVPSMSAVARHLARDLEVHCGVTVSRLERKNERWLVRDDRDSVTAEADAVLVTVPPAQAVPLLAAAPSLADQVFPVAMTPCWSVMLGFAEPLVLPFDAAFVNAGPLAWVARNSSKPGREGKEAWVLHASATWSVVNLEREADRVADILTLEFADRCLGGELPPLSHSGIHRWRYAQPDSALEAPCLFDGELRIGVAGDWCGGPRLEGAYHSGMTLAARLLGQAGEDPEESSPGG